MTDQVRSRRILIAIGALALVLLAAPYGIRRWSETQMLSGKDQLFQDHTYRSAGELLGCLLKRAPGGLTLQVVSENHFADPGRGLAVVVTDHGDYRVVRAWLPKGAVLTPGEAAQLGSCAAR